MTTIRLMPALAVAAGVALTFKISGLASAPWGAMLDAHAAADAAKPDEHPATPGAGDPASPLDANQDQTKKPEPAAVQVASNVSAGDAASQGEADVLRSLAARREALSARERDLLLREQTLAIAEKRVEERVAELKSIEARINAALGQREAAQQEQIQALVKMYESMKPGDAAKIFEKMERGILLAVSSKMKPVKLGAVLALMDPGKAQDLTVLLANRLNSDQIMGPGPAPEATALAPPPQPAAAAPPPVLQPDVLPQPKADAGVAAPTQAPLPPDTLPSTPAPAAPGAAPASNAVPAGAAQTPPQPGKS